jgi:ATP-dependent RNA helicase RhlE
LITEGNWKQILVFTRTKQGANKLTESMISAGIQAAAFTEIKDKGTNKSFSWFLKRESNRFSSYRYCCSWFDIPLLPHVVNFELPNILKITFTV